EHVATALVEKGISCLAVDLRGHGKSEGGPDGYKQFSDEEHQEKVWDVRAAWKFLSEHGVQMERTALVGASIGANLAIRYLAENASFAIAVALSPGRNYRGVTTDDAIVRLTPGQMVLLVASEEDTVSAEAVALLHEKNPLQTEVVLKQDIGHGTDMLAQDRALQDSVIDWVAERI
ncbi:alpha/beta fold hydrolase, partial [candidate division WWE3 bacterium]|nr:alpha/beta fold hydrolase [candidate division WWE3 bacterium]